MLSLYKKILLLTIVPCFIVGHVLGQKLLTPSRQSSFYTYIYKIGPDDVLRFYKYPNRQPDENILHNPVDSFKTDDSWKNNLPAGNYLKVYVQKNKLWYKLIENRSAYLKVMRNNYDLRFILTDKQGSPINNAVVTFNNKMVAYDAKNGLYVANQSKKDTVLKVDYAGVSNYFSVKQEKPYQYRRYGRQNNWLKRNWYAVKRLFKKHYNYPQSSAYSHMGFIVFNKAIYKPNDTVKFKAYILGRKSKQPITAPQLLVRLKERNDNDGKIIGRVNSYRSGAYEYSFVLNDSLKLSLDEDYTISLEDPSSLKYDLDKYDGDDEMAFLAKRNVYLTGDFKYEEYELKSIKFSTRVDKTAHSPGNPPALYLKAVDENNLPVADGRVTVTLLSRGTNRFGAEHLFVPDTLWTHKMPLDPIGETKLMIPDSIFPKADISYEISSEFLNSNNESQSDAQQMTYTDSRYHIESKLNGDTLIATYFDNGKETQATAIISALDAQNDTLSKVKVMLPSKTIINPNAYSYNIEADSAYSDLDLKDSESGISVSGYRTPDSLLVTVENQRHLHFWYSVFGGQKMIDGGQADKLTYAKAYSDKNNVNFLVHYVWAGESKTEATDIIYRDKLLTINVKQPVSVYPGQRVKTDIVVTDNEGKAVANADLTAWSMTSKFTDYKIPFVPYMGKTYAYRKPKKPFNILKTDSEGALKLNWDRWGREIGLDSITYFQFTHPGKFYRVEENIADTVTQVAPFVVKDGDILPVHILYIDGRPVYFDQTQQLKRYSFAVTPGRHMLRFRTSHQNIWVDSVMVERSKKLIISVNATKANSTPVSDTLSSYESDLINKYLITVTNNFGVKMALLQQNDRLFMLNPLTDYRNSILTGPLANNFAVLNVTGEKDRLFETEPNYNYLFEPGLLKQKSIPTTYPFNPVLSSYSGEPDYTQHVLSKNEATDIWQQYLDLRSSTQQLFSNDFSNGVGGNLSFEVNQPKNHRLLVKNVIVYKYNDPDFIQIYPGSTTNIYRLAAGEYRIMFLLKGDVYDLIEKVNIRPYGTNYYKFDILPIHPKDSVSIKIGTIINNRTAGYNCKDYAIENDALKIKEAFNDKYLNTDNFSNVMTGIIASVDDKLPIPGVSVRVKGTSTGAVTDVNGRFKIRVPASGKLLISFIGYEQKEVGIQPGTTVRINLKASSNALNEVVVIGYGTALRKNLTGSVTTISDLQGQVAGLVVTDGAPGGGVSIRIRGMSTNSSAKPLIVVDGEIVESMDGIDKESIGQISVLKDAAATGIYGARAANGVIVIRTKPKPGAPTDKATNAGQAETEQTLRNNFSDYAYWQPKLNTDAQGKASFMATFPDDITNWRTFIIGISDKQQTGFTQNSIKSFKPVSANFIAPQFAVAGDEMKLIGKVMNYNSTAVKLTRTFTYNSKQLQQNDLEVKNSKIDTLGITASATDSLNFEYTIKRDNGYFDGERRKVPVIKQGVEETKGVFEALNGDTTVNLKFDPAMGPVTFRAEASVLPTLAEESRKLREYKYLCNEQLASKLKGLLAERRIKKFLGEEFKYGKNIQEAIKKLQENRKTNGTWGWWKDTDEELWISLHAVEALLDAQKEGYTIQLDKQKLTDYLVYQLESYRGADKLTCLELLRKLEAKVDYAKYIDLVEKENKALKQKTGYSLSGYDKFRLMLVKQEAGLPVKLDSLFDKQHHTLFGNIYWGDDSYRFFDNSVQLSILAYRIIKADGKHPGQLRKIQGYFLEQRSHGEWRNTYESALILETILSDLLVTDKQVKPSAITIKGASTQTITAFPYSATFNPQDMSVSKTGSLPVYITGSQKFWNSSPQKVNKEFAVDTWFERQEKKLTSLKGGEVVQLKAEVTAKGDADFVMIEIPIPAGCSYESKDQSWSNNEVHREYFKEKVSIFCRKLKQGKYTFTVNLIPRYDGKYTLNPAKAEMMYFPVFYGREGIKRVVVGK